MVEQVETTYKVRLPGDIFLPVGTKVCLDHQVKESWEFGVVVHCWMDEEFGFYDCYVAFFGEAYPHGQPDHKPYVLRYAVTSLRLVDEPLNEKEPSDDR